VTIEKHCFNCGKIFFTKPSHNWRKNCSIQCQNLSRRKVKVGRCIICNKEFRFYPNKQVKFCSLLCKGKFFKHKPLIKHCEKCNKEFIAPIKFKIKKYCSKECYTKSQIGSKLKRFWATATKEQKLSRLKLSFEKYAIKNENGCWGWNGNPVRKYPSVQYESKSMLAHRASWLIHHGEIPEGLFVCHHCDNPRCTNPKHLFLGTETDNVRDMYNKGRHPILKGEKAPGSKLTELQVRIIKTLLLKDASWQHIEKIANIMKVSFTTIYDIKAERTWKHINLKYKEKQ
jgi:hypothetical protein